MTTGGRFLMGNGWRIPVANTTGEMRHTPVGEVDPSFTFRPNRARRALPIGMSHRTTPMLKADADTFECLLSNKTHHFPCNTDAWSTNGLGPEAGGGYSIVARSTTAGMFGIGYLNVSSSIVWNPELPASKWTVMYWSGANAYRTATHYVLCSDGTTYQNGVAYVGTPPGITVASGAVAFSAGDYDDIVILPVIASSGFISAFYRWTTGKGVMLHVPFDRYFDDSQDRGLNGTAAGATLAYNDPAGAGDTAFGVRTRGAYFNTTERVSLSGAAINVFGNTELSLEAWADWSGTLGGTEGNIFWKTSGSAGFRMWVGANGSLNAEIHLAGTNALSSSVADAIPGVTAGVRAVHVAATWTKASGAIKLYVNGVLLTLASSTTNPGAISSDDTAITLYVGNDSAGANAFSGTLSEAKLYRLALTQDELRDHYECGLTGIRVPLWKPFSSNMLAWGSSTDWRVFEVVGEVGEQQYLEHTRDGVRRNNSRSISFTLAQRRDPNERKRIPNPHAQFILSEKYFFNNPGLGTDFRMSHGNSAALRVGSGAIFRPGPYGSRAWNPNGAERIDIGSRIGWAMSGMKAITVLVWVRRAAIGALHTIITIDESTNVKMRLDVTAGNLVRMSGKSTSADAVQTNSSVTTYTDTVGWHLVGGMLDLENDVINSYYDFGSTGGSGGGSGVTFGADRFQRSAGGTNRIALDRAGANRWSGEIGVISIWFRELSGAEHAEVYDRGLEGFFR